MLTQLRSKHFSFVQSEGATDRPKEGAAVEKNTKNEGTKRQPRHLQSVPKTADDKHKTKVTKRGEVISGLSLTCEL